MDENKDLKTPVDPEVSDPVTENTQPAAEEAEASAEDTAAEKDYSLDNFDENNDSNDSEDNNDTADVPDDADMTDAQPLKMKLHSPLKKRLLPSAKSR